MRNKYLIIAFLIFIGFILIPISFASSVGDSSDLMESNLNLNEDSLYSDEYLNDNSFDNNGINENSNDNNGNSNENIGDSNELLKNEDMISDCVYSNDFDLDGSDEGIYSNDYGLLAENSSYSSDLALTDSGDGFYNEDCVEGPNLNDSFKNFKYAITSKNTFYVNSSYEGAEEYGTIENPFKTINSAFMNLALNRTVVNIILAEGFYPISNTISITKNLNIIGMNGQNTIISGKNITEIFHIKNNLLINIFNLTFAYGNSYYGGAIYSNRSTVNLVNTVFSENSATVSDEYSSLYSAAGSAIYNEGGTLKFYNSTFKNNFASSTVNSCGGVIYNDMGNIILLNSSFINNSIENTSYGSGGAIYNFNGFLTIFNSSFINNTIHANYSIGGAIYNYESHNVFIINSTFDGNKIYGNYTFASAIGNKGVLLEIINSTISNNWADGIGVENSTVYNYNGVYNFINSTMSNNTIKDIRQNLLMALEDQIIVSNAFDEDLLIDLPSYYDLREEGLVTSVKSQGSSGACWAFTSLAALESFLLKYENISYDFSENNMKNSMGSYGENGTDWTDGGNYQMALAYLLRWDGPVNESDDPFSSYSVIPRYGLNLTKHVQGAIFIPLRMGYLDNAQIKYALMKYGALYTSIYGTSMSKSEYNSLPDIPNHAITIVGWDDDYPASKFVGTKPPGNGAFIIKNSWGSTYGDMGYGYVSYYDKTFAGFGFDSLSVMAFTDVENITNYKDIYQYDPLGNTYESLGFNSNTAWLANQFTANSNNPLSAFGLYTFGKSEYLADIYVNGILKYSQEGSIDYAGYHTIKLNDLVYLEEGDIFRINVRLTTFDSLFPIAIESPRYGYSSKANASLNQSFISYDGITWYDLAENNDFIKFSDNFIEKTFNNTNVCLKAYTANMPSLILNISNNVSYFIKGDSINISLNLTNVGDYIKGINISLVFDDSVILDSNSIICSNGLFDDTNNIWTIDELENDESAVLNLVLSMSQNKNIENLISFNLEGDSYISFSITDNFTGNSTGLIKLNDISESIPFNLYYSSFTKFSEIGSMDIFSKSKDEISIKLFDILNRPIANKEILIDLNNSQGSVGLNYITNESGEIKLIFDLIEGNYTCNILFNGDESYNSSNLSFDVNVVKRDSYLVYDGDNLIYYPNNITIRLYGQDISNSLGLNDYEFLENKTLIFNFTKSNGQETLFDLKTDDLGSSTVFDISSGKYTVTVSLKDDLYYKDSLLNFNISVLRKETKLDFKDMITKAVVVATDGSSGEYFKVVLKDKEGNPLSNKSIQLGFNGKIYNKTTDGNGLAKLQINLARSSIYTFAIRFPGDEEYSSSFGVAKITVNKQKSSLTAPNKSYKASVKTKTLTASLKSASGKALSNKKVTFTVNGKTYFAKTNSKGIASVTVSLSTKKTYAFTVKFSGDNSYSAIAKSSKLIIK